MCVRDTLVGESIPKLPSSPSLMLEALPAFPRLACCCASIWQASIRIGTWVFSLSGNPPYDANARNIREPKQLFGGWQKPGRGFQEGVSREYDSDIPCDEARA